MSETLSQVVQEALEAAHLTPEELRLELALALYARGKLSFGKARELAGVSAWAFGEALARRGVPLSYDLEEFQEDLAALRALGRI